MGFSYYTTEGGAAKQQRPVQQTIPLRLKPLRCPVDTPLTVTHGLVLKTIHALHISLCLCLSVCLSLLSLSVKDQSLSLSLSLSSEQLSKD